MLDLTTLLDGLKVVYTFKFSRNEEDKKAKITKRIKGTFLFDGMTIQEGLDKAVRQAAISWQHSNRPDYDKFEDNQACTIMVMSAGRKQVDHEAATASKFAGADIEGRKEILRKVVGESMTDEELDKLLKSGLAVDVSKKS